MDKATLKEKLLREKQFVDKTVKMLEDVIKHPDIDVHRVSAASKYVYEIYMGIENILKISLKAKGIEVISSPEWHHDLIELAKSKDLISQETFEKLESLLGFRHFVAHGYSAILDKERVLELGEMAMSTWNKFIPELESGLNM
jgi:uncharacterized protein YutE (UPF0331/DUF86 family)